MATDALDEVIEYSRTQALRDELKESDVPAFLRGYFRNLFLTDLANTIERDRKTGDYVFPGMGLVWEEPGTPFIPAALLRNYEHALGPLTRMVKLVFSGACRSGQLQRLSTANGQHRADLLHRMGLGAYA